MQKGFRDISLDDGMGVHTLKNTPITHFTHTFTHKHTHHTYSITQKHSYTHTKTHTYTHIIKSLKQITHRVSEPALIFRNKAVVMLFITQVQKKFKHPYTYHTYIHFTNVAHITHTRHTLHTRQTYPTYHTHTDIAVVVAR